MKKLTIISILSLAALLTGCSKDAEVNAFIAELDSATNEIVAKIDANPSSAGIEDAQKAFDARKPELTAKWNEIKDAVGAQVSAETKKKLEESVTNNMKALTEASMRNMMKMASDKEASVKYRRLLEDYSRTFTVAS
jgi:hypothetical protein